MNSNDPRHLAYEVLLRVEEGAYSDLALDAALARLPRMDPRDRALATELVYGTLRLRGRLDFALSRFCRQPLAKVEPRVQLLLRLGAHQILHLDRIPSRAAVHTTVELARREKLERVTGFINGILRTLDREKERIPWPPPENPASHLEHSLSVPGWLARRWLRELPAAGAIALGEAMSRPAPFTLRTNTLRIDRDRLLEQWRAAGHEAEPTPFAPEGIVLTARGEGPLPGSAEGWFQVQDEASMLIARLLDPRPGEAVLDACAAPGGKTTHLAALTENRADITALDLHPQRIALVEEGARRLGAERVAARPWDLTRSPGFLTPESFDRILVDAPCSGLGVLRRNPELRWRRKEKDLQELAALQEKILENVVPLLRPGGVLLYSLCTQTPEETEGVVMNFLTRHPEIHREDLREHTPPQWRELFDEQGALRTLPHRHGGMDAFFAVRFRKK